MGLMIHFSHRDKVIISTYETYTNFFPRRHVLPGNLIGIQTLGGMA